MAKTRTEAWAEYSSQPVEQRDIHRYIFFAGWDARDKEAKAKADEVTRRILHELNNERPDYIRYGNIVAILLGGEPVAWHTTAPELSEAEKALVVAFGLDEAEETTDA